MRAICLVLLAVGVVAVLPASAARSRIVCASWADTRHGWISCGEATVCSTEDGGRSWDTIFSGGNHVFFYRRTSATAGVVEAGNWVSGNVWTRDNGRTWYELPNIPGADYPGRRTGTVLRRARSLSLLAPTGANALPAHAVAGVTESSL
jgi:photosystem II stability/assembly factor-like uncharacterized protein